MTHHSTTRYRAHASTTGYGADAVAVNGAAQSEHDVAIGRWVKLSPTSNAAVVMPELPCYRPEVVSASDGWAIGVWITMQDGFVTERPDVLLPNDGRDYMLTIDGDTYRAGCRRFTYTEAVEHWSNPDHEAPESAKRLLDAVQAHHESTTT